MKQLKIQKFWANVERGRNKEDCWIWKGKRHYLGYGRYGKEFAHRLSYKLSVGSIPFGLHVRHKCDNPPCVNPDHLELGTHKQNMQDRDERGRCAKGEQIGQSTLGPEAVAVICYLYSTGRFSQRKIAKYFGISNVSVSSIVRGETWKHVERKISVNNKLTGERNKASKLNTEKAKRIRYLYATGEYSTSKLATMFGVTKYPIQQVLLNRTWNK